MIILIFITIFIACVSNTVEGAGQSRIIGGHDVPPGFGKFHASLQNLTGHHVCGGAIISHRHAVTAAHCVVGVNYDYIKVVVGTTNLKNGAVEYAVESIYIHESYNTTRRIHDIAVIKIRNVFDLRHVDIIQLGETELEEGDSVTVSGFGALAAQGESSKRMQALNLRVFNQETCKFALRYTTRRVYSTMFCTFTRIGEGTCYGDSGGPLIKDKKLVGLVSWGIPCGSGFPDVHTRIHIYIDWIRQILGQTSTQYCRQRL